MLERLIRSSLARPLLVAMAVTLASAWGWSVLAQLPRDVYPELNIPVFTVITENTGMAAEELETLVTQPIEGALNGLPGARRVRSSSQQGVSAVTIEFDIEQDIWRSRQFVTERLSQVLNQLPAGTKPPALASVSSRLAEVYEFALVDTRPHPDLTALRDLGDWNVRLRLMTVPGVSDVLTMGGYLRQFQVEPLPARLQGYGLSATDVATAIQQANENVPAGFVTQGLRELTVRGLGRLETLDDLRRVWVAERNGVPITLDQVATVREGHAIRRGIVSLNGREAVSCTVIKQVGADTVTTVEGVKRALAEIQATLPAGVRVEPFYDTTRLIDHALESVQHAILVGALLVVVVLFLLLGNVRSALIVALSLPLAVLVASLLLRLFGVGINTMSLGGLAIAVGVMVDASIIMTENMVHRLHGSQEGALARAMAAASEVGRPIAFATLIIVAVFLPMFMLEGLEGKLFKPLALTVVAAMLSAMALSLTLAPVLSFRLLQGAEDKEVRLVGWLKGRYARLLDGAFRSPWPVVGATMLVTVLALALTPLVGRSFMPEIDERGFWNRMVMPPETSLAEADALGAVADRVYRSFPEVTQVLRRTGHAESPSGEAEPVNVSEINVNLAPQDEAKRPKAAMTEAMRAAIARIPGQTTEFVQPLAMRIEEGLAGTPAAVSVRVFGPDLAQLDRLGAQVQAAVAQVPGVVDLRRDQLAGVPQLQVRFDRERANAKGVSVRALADVLETAVGGLPVTTVVRNQRTYGLVQRYPDTVRLRPEELGNLLVPASAGRFVPLKDVATVSTTLGPNVIRRESMSRRVSVDFNVAGSDLGGVVDAVRRRVAAIPMADGYYVSYSGQYESAQRAGKTLAFATLVAMAVIFMLLFLALGSAAEAGLILVTLPVALVGGVLSLLLSGQTLNVSSGVGFIALFGIAVQNGLVLVTQTRQLMDAGMPLAVALREASIGRLRPKLMTASCAMLGLLPLVVTSGVGSEIEKPMAIVMIGGLVTSTLFTLLVLPVAYSLALGRCRRVVPAEPVEAV